MSAKERMLIGETAEGVRIKVQIDEQGGLAIVNANGVPTDFSASMMLSKNDVVNPGELNKLRFRPTILNEHAESSREIMGTVTSGTIMGQIFKASQDNINGILSTLESAEAETTIDDVEQANDGALQAAWVASNQLAVLETTIVSPNKSSTKSMKLDMDTLSDKWTFTKAATSWNMAGATIELDYQQSRQTADATMTISINDGANTSVLTLAIPASLENTWQHLSVPVDGFSGTADTSAITNVFFQVTQKRALAFAYVDNVRFRPDPGTLLLKLWDCGGTIPVADGASFDLATDAIQYIELGDRGIGGVVVAALTLNLEGGKRLYSIESFIAGVAGEIPANTVLNVGNYYAITLHHTNTDVSVFGPDTTFSIDYYTNGYAFSTSAENVDITKINGAAGSGAFSDLMFGIFSTQQIYVEEAAINFLDSNGALTPTDPDVDVSVYLEDENMSITAVLGHHVHGMGTGTPFDLARPSILNKGGKIEAYLNASINDSVASSTFKTGYLYIPPTVNG